MTGALRWATFGWLAFSGTAHFLTDVVSHRLRGLRPPGLERTLYEGLNTSFALGQVAIGALGLWLAWRAPDALRHPAPWAILLLVALGWLAITFLFMEYREPRANALLVVGLVGAALVTSRG